MSLEAMIGTLVGISAIISSSALGVKWLVKHYFDDIRHELKPNGGSSLKDQVNRLEKDMQEAEQTRREMNQKIDHMYEVLLDYIAKNQRPATPSRSKKLEK
jgi:pyrroloquinoline quinone (PQQ) biosynthesis protein C